MRISCIALEYTLYPFSSIAFKIGSVIFNSLNVINVIFAVSAQRLILYIVREHATFNTEYAKSPILNQFVSR